MAAKSINQTFNYKESMQYLKNKPKRRALITSKNAEASLLIKAGQLLSKVANQDEVDTRLKEIKEAVKAGINSPSILTAQVSILKDHIDHLNEKISELKVEKENKGGVLQPKREALLNEYKKQVEELNAKRIKDSN